MFERPKPQLRLNPTRALTAVAAGLASVMAGLGVTGAMGVGGLMQAVLSAAFAGYVVGRFLRTPRATARARPLKALYQAARARQRSR